MKATVITGATGFVGGELLKTLLLTSDRRFICPVRAESDEAAIDRGETRLQELLGAEHARLHAPRLSWVRADIELPHLSLSPADWLDIANRTEEIFHCAASVAFDLPVAAAHRINVDGTKHVFELAMAAASHHRSFKRFHYVSTAYVAGKADGVHDASFLPPDESRQFRNSYERTKARAERYLRSAATDQIPISIYRPSIIAGHSTTGVTTSWNVLYVPMNLCSRGAAPVFPRAGRELLDTIPIDYVVRAIAAFASSDTERLQSHHLTAGNEAFTVSQVLAEITHQSKLRGLSPSQTKLLGPVQWGALTVALALAARAPKRLRKLRSVARLARRNIDRSSAYLAYGSVNSVFDATTEHRSLRLRGIEMPSGPNYLRILTSYALDSNFGKRDLTSAHAPRERERVRHG